MTSLRCLVLILSLCSHGFAQSSASLAIVIFDPNGAAVPGATVDAELTATGLRRSFVTGDDGRAVFPAAPAGAYAVTVQAPGFARARVEGIVLNVNDSRSVPVTLTLAQTEETVTVTAPASLLETAAVGTAVDRRFVETMPLNGRSFQSLIALSPGVVNAPASASNPGQFSVNGQRTSSNYFTIDGVSANFGITASFVPASAEDGTVTALSASGGTNTLVSIDALEEFKLLTSSYAAEFGRSPGGQITMLTRSGTNRFTGTLFNYFRNDALDASDWFANRDGLPKPAMRQNDFGGVLGGPVVRDRTFFFVSYEGLRLRQPQFSTAAYPSLAARAATSAERRPAVDAYPIPNLEDLPNGYGRFAATYSNPSSLDATSVKVDHHMNSRMRVFGRYNVAPSTIGVRGGPGFRELALNTVSDTEIGNHTATFGATATLGATKVNDFRLNFSRNTAFLVSSLDTFGGAAPPPESFLFPGFARPASAVTGIYLLDTTGFASGVSADNAQNQWNLVNTFSWVAGRHEWKFGLDFRRLTPDKLGPAYRQTIAFRDLLGPQGLQRGNTVQTVIELYDPIRIALDNWSLFAQDTWRVSPRLTFNYGLRWEYNPAPSSASGKPIHGVVNIDRPADLALGAAGAPLFDAPRNSFAPRAGIAYQLRQRQGRELVLRAGGGVFYDLQVGAVFSGFFNPPLRSVRRLLGTPFPVPPAQQEGIPLSTTGPFDVLAGFHPDFHVPRSYQWNVALEQSMGTAGSVSASYVAATGRRLTRLETYSRPNTDVGFAQIYRNLGTSDYHALQLQYRRPLQRGLQALFSYTWGHAIDEASSNVARFVSADVTTPDANRGSADFDVRHLASGALSWDLPSPRLWRPMLGGWGLDSLFRMQTAFPVDIFASTQTPLGPFDLRPNLVPGQPLTIESAGLAGGRRFNAAAFSRQVAGSLQHGSLGRNVLRAFPAGQVDLTARRTFSLTERSAIQFRADFFNVTNTPSFAAPSGNLVTPLFGQSVQMFNRGLGAGGAAGGQNPLFSLGGPRSVQLSLKLVF
ncbi:MAG: TonB-dependent receptor [Bryobacterales bacterium]|nr:TonB-dependent receptor [Bryobacterales bacterium]